MDYQLTHIRLLVPAAHFADCVAFYRDILGFKTNNTEPPYVEFQTGGVIVALFHREIMAAAAGTADLRLTAKAQDPVVLCLAVEDVDACCADLKAKGVHIAVEPHDQPEWMLRLALLRDPAGNLIEINRNL